MNTRVEGRNRGFFGEAGVLLWAVVIATAALWFCTRSSYYYLFNNWDDVNSYFSMGKSLFHGTVIYRDLFDQKGPWLYFLYGLCSLVSRTTFHGVFWMEVVFLTLDLWAAHRIFTLYVSKRTSLFLLPFVPAVVFTTRSFYWGGCAEELCLPAMLWSLYVILRHEKGILRSAGVQAPQSTEAQTSQEERIRTGAYGWKSVFLVGLAAGYVAGIKFTLLGFFFGCALLMLWRSGSIGKALRTGLLFLLAMALPFVPWLIFFGIHGAIDDFYRVYIYTNVFIYSTFGAANKGEGIWEKAYSLAKILYWLIRDNAQYFAFIGAGFVAFLLRAKASLLQRILLPALFGLTFLGIYIGGAEIPYYSLPLTVFAVPGFAAVGEVAERFFQSLSKNTPTQEMAERNASANMLLLGIALLVCLTAATAFAAWRTPNRYYRDFAPEDLFLTQFARDIREGGIDDPTLLNYQCLDCGLYTMADIYPTCYWFQLQTLATPVVYEEQHRYVREGQVDYIVARHYYPAFFLDNYEVIDHFHQVMGEEEYDYYLLRKRG